MRERTRNIPGTQTRSAGKWVTLPAETQPVPSTDVERNLLHQTQLVKLHYQTRPQSSPGRLSATCLYSIAEEPNRKHCSERRGEEIKWGVCVCVSGGEGLVRGGELALLNVQQILPKFFIKFYILLHNLRFFDASVQHKTVALAMRA